MSGRALVLLKLNSADLDQRIQDIERRISRLEDAILGGGKVPARAGLEKMLVEKIEEINT
jgi:hypothetical protein